MLEAKGDLAKATTVLQDLAVETFGSMERREKTDFILEQMRLNLALEDFTRVGIVSKKINTKFFEAEENSVRSLLLLPGAPGSSLKSFSALQDLKLRFYDIMIAYALHEKKHLDACRYYREVYSTKSIKEDEEKLRSVVESIVYLAVLSPYDNEQSDLMARISAMPELTKAESEQ